MTNHDHLRTLGEACNQIPEAWIMRPHRDRLASLRLMRSPRDSKEFAFMRVVVIDSSIDGVIRLLMMSLWMQTSVATRIDSWFPVLLLEGCQPGC